MSLLSLLLCAAPIVGGTTSNEPGTAGASKGLAVLARKALTVPETGPQVIDNAVMLVFDGRIEAIGSARSIEIPEGYEVLDVGDQWIMPGMVGLHCHVASTNFFTNDLNDMVYLTNPGLRASTSVVPGNRNLEKAAAGGVTTVLYIPGSGTNIGGQGVLLKTGLDEYERMEIRNPGSLKLAQAGNPERWVIGPGRSFQNWNTRRTFRTGLAYAQRWREFEEGRGEKPEKDIRQEVFRDLLERRTQVSTHTQIYQVVLMTIMMVREELGLDVFIDHGSFDGHRTAPLAAEKGVPAILGPRAIAPPLDFRHPIAGRIVNDTDGKILGMAAEYQRGGVEMIGFNTDAPVIPQEELPLQAAVAVRYGFDNKHVQHVRGVTIVPAITAGIEDRVGSLEPGKDADFLLIAGDPADPRSVVSMTFIEGERVYDSERDGRRW